MDTLAYLSQWRFTIKSTIRFSARLNSISIREEEPFEKTSFSRPEGSGGR
jgi:hypothetical protein